MSGKKSGLPDGRVPDRNPDGTPAVPWKSRWTEGPLPLGCCHRRWHGCDVCGGSVLLRLLRGRGFCLIES